MPRKPDPDPEPTRDDGSPVGHRQRRQWQRDNPPPTPRKPVKQPKPDRRTNTRNRK